MHRLGPSPQGRQIPLLSGGPPFLGALARRSWCAMRAASPRSWCALRACAPRCRAPPVGYLKVPSVRLSGAVCAPLGLGSVAARRAPRRLDRRCRGAVIVPRGPKSLAVRIAPGVLTFKIPPSPPPPPGESYLTSKLHGLAKLGFLCLFRPMFLPVLLNLRGPAKMHSGAPCNGRHCSTYHGSFVSHQAHRRGRHKPCKA